MRAARYARVSTRDQAKGTSIPNQLERTAAYISAQGWELVSTFTEPGESGENLDRPAMTAARQAAQRDQFDILVIYTLDRLTRDIDDLFLLRREFQAARLRIWAVQEGLDVTTADVDDLLSVLFRGYVGHRELATTRRRTMEGIDRHVRAGRFAGGTPPYGYRRTENNYLEAYEPEARIVTMMFTWSAEKGDSCYTIAERLNAMGVPSPGGKLWATAVVHRFLRRKTYIGRWTYGKRGEHMSRVTVDCPALVPQELWEQAQATLQRNKSCGRPATAGRPYLLKGLIRCQCGRSYVGRRPRREGGAHRYRCVTRCGGNRPHLSAPCRSPSIRGPSLEEAIWADITSFVRQPQVVAAALASRREPAVQASAARLAEADQAIAERKAELDRYLALYGRGTIPVDQLDAKAAEVRGHLAALDEYRAALAEEQRRADRWEHEMASVVEAMQLLQDRLDAGVNWEDKRDLVAMLVKGIRIETRTDDSGKRTPIAHVTYRFEQPATEIPIPIEMEPVFGGEERRQIATRFLERVMVCRHSLFELEREVRL